MSHILNYYLLLLGLLFRRVAKKTSFHPTKCRRFLSRINLCRIFIFCGLYDRVLLRLSKSDLLNVFLFVDSLLLSFFFLSLFQDLCHVIQRWRHIIIV